MQKKIKEKEIGIILITSSEGILHRCIHCLEKRARDYYLAAIIAFAQRTDHEKFFHGEFSFSLSLSLPLKPQNVEMNFQPTVSFIFSIQHIG